MIPKTDKGNNVVLIDHLSYVKEVEKLLNDRSKFVKIDFNPKHQVDQDIMDLLDMEFEIKSCLDDFYNYNYLWKGDYKFLKPCGSKPGVMYGMCKVHKGTTDNDNVPPFRSILSAIGTCNYNLLYQYRSSLGLMNILSKILFHFVIKSLIKILIFFMASFDTQSLFTNIPLDETIDICVDMVFEKRKKVKGMLKCHFKQFRVLSVKSSCFLFNGVCYKQIDDVAMGSPLGPTLANLFLVDHQHK